MQKLISLIGCAILMSSCNTVKFFKAEKTEIKMGVPNGTPFFRYMLEVAIIKNEVQFLNIEIDESFNINSFSVINLKTRIQADNSTKYDKGKYLLQFDFPFNEKLKHNQVIILSYENKGNVKTLAKTIQTTKAYRLR